TPPDQAIEIGLDQLQSLLEQLEKQQPNPSQNQAKQAREALVNIQTGLRNEKGSNDRSQQIYVLVEEELKASESQVDVERLKQLLAQLRRFSVETSEHLKKEEKPDLANFDPGKIPPAYRGRIEKYFQKLSER